MVQLPLAFLAFLLPLKCEHTNAMAYPIYEQIVGIGESICRQMKQFVCETTFTDSNTLFTPAFSVTCIAATFCITRQSSFDIIFRRAV